MSNSSLVMIEDFSCGYSDRLALRRLSLSFAIGQTTALMGPGGGGKSTLLRLLANVEAPQASFWSTGHLSHSLGQCAVLRQKTARDQRSLGGVIRDGTAPGESVVEVVRRVWLGCAKAQEALLSHMDDTLENLPMSVVRLAAFTATMARTVDTYLLDEPDAGLDPQHLAWVTDRLEQARGTASIIIATHHLRLARKVSDRAILLVRGELVEAGPTQSLFDAPQHPRTKTFVHWGS